MASARVAGTYIDDMPQTFNCQAIQFKFETAIQYNTMHHVAFCFLPNIPARAPSLRTGLKSGMFDKQRGNTHPHELEILNTHCDAGMAFKDKIVHSKQQKNLRPTLATLAYAVLTPSLRQAYATTHFQAPKNFCWYLDMKFARAFEQKYRP